VSQRRLGSNTETKKGTYRMRDWGQTTCGEYSWEAVRSRQGGGSEKPNYSLEELAVAGWWENDRTPTAKHTTNGRRKRTRKQESKVKLRGETGDNRKPRTRLIDSESE
jgi:hypothetical protein